MIVILDGAAEVFIFKKGIQHFFLQVVHVTVVHGLINLCFCKWQVFNHDLLGQRFGGVFFLGFIPKCFALITICFGPQQFGFDIFQVFLGNFQFFPGVGAGFNRADFKINRKQVVFNFSGNLLFIVIIEGFFDLLQNRVIIHAQQRIQKSLGYQIFNFLAGFGEKITQVRHVDEFIFFSVG